MDLVVRASRLPLPGETVMGGGYRTFPGGKGANQAVAAARMGARVSLVGALGDDAHAAKLRAALEPEGIDLTYVQTRVGEASGLALITVAEGGENTIVVAPGANASLTEADATAAKDIVEASDVILAQLESPTAFVHAIARYAKGAGRAFILNAAPARVLPRDLLKLTDVLIVNRTEAATLLQMEPSTDPARLALRLPELGCTSAILTLGAQGAILTHKGRPRRVPTVNVQTVDSVGAGDAFCGTLAASWRAVHEAAKGRSQEEFPLAEQAVIYAAVAGALATTRPGAIASMPQGDEVRAQSAGLRIV